MMMLKKKVKLNKLLKKRHRLKKKKLLKKVLTNIAKKKSYLKKKKRWYFLTDPNWWMDGSFLAEISMFFFKAGYWTIICTNNPCIIWKEMTYAEWWFMFNFIRFVKCYLFFLSVCFMVEYGAVHTESDLDVLHKSFFDDTILTSANILLELPKDLDDNPLNTISTKHYDADFHIVILAYTFMIYCFKMWD